MEHDAILQESRALRQAIARHRSYRDWERGREAHELRGRVEALLDTIRTWTASDPRPSDGLHLVHWNILHGASYDGVLRALTSDESLAGADFVSLNEVDLGLARSGNRDVAFDLARALNMHAVWTPLFLELDGGHLTPPELQRQEQRESLFGLALLSRYPLGAVRRIELPTPREYLFTRERKVGSFVALHVEIRAPLPFVFVVTPLDVHGTPEKRRLQMARVLQNLPAGPAVVCGDLNPTTFRRGGWGRTAATLGTLALSPRAALDRRLRRPDLPADPPREPLFTELARHGFAHVAFNQERATLDLRLHDTQEYRALPGIVRTLARGLFRRVERRTRHRLDWIAARGFEADPARPPFTRQEWMRGEDAPSDHAPIGVGLRPVP